MIIDVLYDILWSAGIPAKKEAPINFLITWGESRSTLILADVLVYSRNGGEHIYVDFIWVSSLSGFEWNVIVGHAATKTTETKVRKHN